MDTFRREAVIIITYQDFLVAQEKGENYLRDWLCSAINKHKGSDGYKMAVEANAYDKQQNTTIMDYIKYMYNTSGHKVVDFTASNTKICSNFFHRLNTQRNTYLLGNGVSFTDHKTTTTNADGTQTVTDETKDRLGSKFDNDLKEGGYQSLIHGVTFGFWDFNRIVFFPITEFVPLWDEDTSDLRGGIRFWQLQPDKPLNVTLYEEDGFTKYKKDTKKKAHLEEVQPKRGYIKSTTSSQDGGVEKIEYSNYKSFPIIPLWGSKLHQSTLVGMRGGIDSFDLIRSGFANDLEDIAQIYWILNGADGMSEKDMADFRRRLKLNHIAKVDEENSSVTTQTMDIPYQAREAFLTDIRNSIYEDFGALDVHTVAAGATNDHIDAAYQPMDEEADDFEYQVTDFIQSLLDLMGIVDYPVFKRNRISNQGEQTQMVLSAAEYLDTETILNKLPFVTVDEVSQIMTRKDRETDEQMITMDDVPDETIEVEKVEE